MKSAADQGDIGTDNRVAETISMIARLPLSDSEKANAVKLLLTMDANHDGKPTDVLGKDAPNRLGNLRDE